MLNYLSRLSVRYNISIKKKIEINYLSSSAWLNLIVTSTFQKSLTLLQADNLDLNMFQESSGKSFLLFRSKT